MQERFKTYPKNYKLVLLLPLVSKVIEKVIHNKTEIFLSKNKILYKYQSGFQKSFSTKCCLTLLTDKINKGFECGKYTGLISIDLQKAWFEYHGLNHIFWEEPLKLILIKKFSDPGNLTCGIPQGSILGPLLKCDLFLYTDDTCLTFQHGNVKEIEDQLNSNFSSLCDWFIDSKLSIHLGKGKTKFILFGTKPNIKQAEPLNTVYGNVRILDLDFF